MAEVGMDLLAGIQEAAVSAKVTVLSSCVI